MGIKGPKLDPYRASILEIDTDDAINTFVNIRVRPMVTRGKEENDRKGEKGDVSSVSGQERGCHACGLEAKEGQSGSVPLLGESLLESAVGQGKQTQLLLTIRRPETFPRWACTAGVF